MKIEAVRKTAVSRFEPKEKVHIVESPLLGICHGIHENEAEAWEIFEDILQSMYIKYLEGKQVAQYSRGRPAKGNVNMHIQVKPESRDSITNLAKQITCSQGEAIDFLIHFYRCKSIPDQKSAVVKPIRPRKKHLRA